MPRSATCAAPICSGVAPKAFDKCTRMRLPPRLARTTMRTVWLLNPEGGGAGRGVAPAAGSAEAGAGPFAPAGAGPGPPGPRPGPAARGCCSAAAHVATQCMFAAAFDTERWANAACPKTRAEMAAVAARRVKLVIGVVDLLIISALELLNDISGRYA